MTKASVNTLLNIIHLQTNASACFFVLGTVSAILFYILALQTGLTSLDPDKRFVRLCRNFCLLFTAVLHFIHNIVNPLLMSLSASHNPSLKRHLRALLVCAFLVVFPILLLVYLWSQHDASTWLLAVSAFSVEVSKDMLIGCIKNWNDVFMICR